MSSGFRDLLGPARRAPKSVHRQGLKTKAMITHAARAVVRECLKDARGGFTAKEIFVQVPVLAASYTDANALGTALGEGVRGRGLGLHRDRDGSFLRCRDNATLAAEHLEDAEIDDLTAELGFRGADGLAEAINQLPSAQAGPPPEPDDEAKLDAALMELPRPEPHWGPESDDLLDSLCDDEDQPRRARKGDDTG